MNMNWLFSMRLAFVLLVSVTLWFGLGMALTEYDVSRQAFKALNALPMLQWLDTLIAVPIAGFWIVGLFGLMFLLGVNTALCSWRDLLPVWRKKRWSSSRIMMLPIHLLTLLVFIFHGVDLVFLHGHDKVQMQQGDSFSSGRYQIELVKVDYKDDINLIIEDKDGFTVAGKVTRRSIEQFDPRQNIAHFIVNDGEQQVSGDASFMRQFRVDDLYLTVTDFSVPYQQESSGVQVSIVAVHNPLVNYFFVCYSLLLVSLLLQGVVFWRKTNKKGHR